MAQAKIRAIILMTAAITTLTACVDGGNPFAKSDDSGPTQTRSSTSTRLVDRDVEAPEVFQTTDKALWDGRPSLGGVWIASPDTKDPERVIIRNRANGKFVIGALFRREIENPGPKLQISSDAAAALGILAGQPADVSVIALRREENNNAPDATKPILDSSETVKTTALDPIAGAAVAIDRAETKPGPSVPVVGAKPAATTAPVTAPASIATPPATAAANATGARSIQIGIFSVEANAKRAVAQLQGAGLTADLRREESQGKALWSVTSRGDTGAMTKVKSLGFPDAYFLKR